MNIPSSKHLNLFFSQVRKGGALFLYMFFMPLGMSIAMAFSNRSLLVNNPNSDVGLVSGNVYAVSWTSSQLSSNSLVAIDLSLDGGQTFTVVLRASTPNDGREDIIVPNMPTLAGRFRVRSLEQNISSMSPSNFRILSSLGTVATPVISPGTGTLSGPTNVIMTCATPNSKIYYTTNGNIPMPGTVFTKEYSQPFAIVENTTIRAMATRSEFTNSGVAVSILAFSQATPQAATPIITPGSGTFSGPVTVSITSSTSGAQIYYSTSGNVPVVGASHTLLYNGPFTLQFGTTVRAISVRSGMLNSSVAVSNIAINNPPRVAKPVINPGTSTFNGTIQVSISTETQGATIFYSTTGNEPVPGASHTRTYTGPFSVNATTTVRAMAQRSGMMQSLTDVAFLTAAIPPQRAATPIISPGTGTYNGPQIVSISSSTPNAQIYYTTSGNVPVVGTSFTRLYTGPFAVNSTSTVRAIAVREGFENSSVTAAFLTINLSFREAFLSGVESQNNNALARDKEFGIFPNPVVDLLNIEIGSGSGDRYFRLFNALGAEIKAIGKLTEGRHQIDLSNLNSGIYFITEDGSSKTQRIVKK